MDEKSLIKKYQREISSLKQELQQLKRGMMERPYISSNQEDLVNLKLQVPVFRFLHQNYLYLLLFVPHFSLVDRISTISTFHVIPYTCFF